MRSLRMAAQASRAVAENRTRTFLMMLGVIVGVAALTIIASSVFGARRAVMDRVEKFGVDQIMVMAGAGRRPGVPQPIPTTLRVEDADAMLSEIDNVRDVSPQILRRDFPVKYANKSYFGMVVAANANWSSVWNTGVESGRFISEEDVLRLARAAVIGRTIVNELFQDEDPVGKQILLGNNPFEVVGVLEKRGSSPGGHDWDSRMIIPLSTGRKRVFNQDYLFMIKVALDDTSKMAETVKDIQALLRERHNLAPGVEDDFTLVTPSQVMALLSKVSTTFNIFLSLVSVVSLIVGAIVMANIMFIAVNERRSEIGIRRAVGARRKDILLQFLLEALIVAALGGLIGIAVGFVGLKALAAFMKIPSAMMWQPALIALLSAVVVGLIAGIQPARRAAGVSPVESLS